MSLKIFTKNSTSQIKLQHSKSKLLLNFSEVFSPTSHIKFKPGERNQTEKLTTITILERFFLLFFHYSPEQKRNRQTCERATGILFDAKRPLERLFPDCWTPLEGTLFIVVFLEPSVPDMLGTLKLPCML